MISECMAVDFRIINARTQEDQKEKATGQLTATLSAWHCKQKCRTDGECTWFAWHYYDNGEDGIFLFSLYKNYDDTKTKIIDF